MLGESGNTEADRSGPACTVAPHRQQEASSAFVDFVHLRCVAKSRDNTRPVSYQFREMLQYTLEYVASNAASLLTSIFWIVL